MIDLRWMVLGMMGMLLFWAACHRPVAKGHVQNADDGYRYGGYVERVGEHLRDIDSAGGLVIQGYGVFVDKGPWMSDRRITLLPEKTNVQVGETLRIFHALEDRSSKGQLWIMGPKAIYGLWVDGVQWSDPDDFAGYPGGMVYDGRVLPAPDWDYNFEITKLSFDAPGEHEVVWKLDGLVSNVVLVSVR